ncbi:MAG: DUF4180 domain-containing protein [Eubacteriales bacterium]|nr:DUF4180 domain-containing protein [Eubacteriales bacterium]MDY2601408.1 DUF4180 domain-containing protein [Eubacteriales bacterium]
MDLLTFDQYETGCKNLLVPKELVCAVFFRLSTGLAGEILQKYVNYAGRVAFFGDFSLSQQEAPALLTR